MGCYINPLGMSKEQWLLIRARPTQSPGPITETEVPVVLVDNGGFTAAGVAYDEEELRRFNNPRDPRPRVWFQVPRADVRQVSDLAAYEAHLSAPTR